MRPRKASKGLERPKGEASEALQYRVHMVAKWPVCATPNLGSQNLSNSGFACMGLPCARFSHVEHSYKFKAACGGRGSQFPALSACLWAPVETARLSPKIEESAAPKLGPPDGPNFGVAVSQPRNLVPNCITRAGSIRGPNFWGRETAPFFGPGFEPVGPSNRISLAAPLPLFQ